MNKELKDFIVLEAKRLGYTVLEINLKGRAGLSVDITLDKSGGITLDECSEFNRTVSEWLDKSDAAVKGYTVDVASPGLDRVLRTDEDFQWAVGKKARVNVSDDAEGERFYEGEIRSVDSETLVIGVLSGEDAEIKRRYIVKAQLLPEI
jgi:ribosome maturation factor RimP